MVQTTVVLTSVDAARCTHKDKHAHSRDPCPKHRWNKGPNHQPTPHATAHRKRTHTTLPVQTYPTSAARPPVHKQACTHTHGALDESARCRLAHVHVWSAAAGSRARGEVPYMQHPAQDAPPSTHRDGFGARMGHGRRSKWGWAWAWGWKHRHALSTVTPEGAEDELRTNH